MTQRRSPLDGLAARLVALCVAVGMAALLAHIHWHHLFPPPPPEGVSANDPAAACIAGQFATIDAQGREGLFDAAQLQRMRLRAEAMCRARFGAPPGGGGPVPGLPGLAPTPLPQR